LQSHEDKVVAIQASADSTALAIIAPYQNAIEEEMNEVLSFTKTELNKNGAESTLGNFVTDLCLNYADAHMCVMNNGGLRTTINKGNITRGKLYELMPFENELVVLKLNKEDYLGLLTYICKRGGEPFSGISITMKEDGEIINYSQPVDFSKGEKVKVLTSDYLANGGDKMSFFQDKEQIKVGLKLRDAIIDYCSKTDTINVQLDGRLKIIENGK
jgi:2',3'-cyclic-nucleotide 2'-phosphodiesterase (5'-nucleotidase family)